MKPIVVTALFGSVLILGACAAQTQTPVAPTIAIGTGTAEGWAAGNLDYLRVNGLRRGWTTTESGLQYRRVGPARPAGRQPVAADTVKVHYRGTFIDGRQFDSSYDRGEPAEFPLGRVIKGWTEGVALMREGEKFEFVIPASLGYGQRWVGGDELPPDSTLLFTVELLEVKPAA